MISNKISSVKSYSIKFLYQIETHSAEIHVAMINKIYLSWTP